MQRSGNKTSNDTADQIYLSYSVGNDRNTICYSNRQYHSELSELKEEYDKQKNSKKISLREIAVKLLCYSKRLGDTQTK